MAVPCKGCTARSAECHSRCDRYAAFAALRRTILAEKYHRKEFVDALQSSYEYTIKKRKRERKP